MPEKTRKKKRWFAVSILVLSLAVFTGCSIKKQKSDTGSPSKADATTYQVVGVVLKNETKDNRLEIRGLESDVVNTVTYGATSKILDSYEEEREGSDIEVGEILDVSYDAANAKIVSAKVPENVWEYDEVKKFSFDSEENMMKVSGEKFQYSQQTYFGANGNVVEPMEFSDQDLLTVRGVGIEVYSVVRTSGHGYIRLTNYKDFVGGMAEVGNKVIVPISDNMLITAAEGTYRLTLTKSGSSTTKTVTVKSDTETTVDFSDYKPTAKNVGQVTFQVEPEGADLYINGTAVNYDKPIALNYGKYNVTVTMTGYESYSGVLTVQEASKTIRIDLIEEEASATSSSSPTATPVSSESSSSNESDNTVTKKIDSDHTITVSAPEGAQVYLDNVYKGLAPCTFTKVIGSQTITLSDTGYVTKSYSVDILDDGKNTKLSFADLVKDTE